jgi:signal transduction histidine kinase
MIDNKTIFTAFFHIDNCETNKFPIYNSIVSQLPIIFHTKGGYGMLSEYSNDTIAGMVKSNPELEALIQSITTANKKTTSMFVHELRNPLALLKGTIQYIEMKQPEVKNYKYWDQVQELINDMEHIMQDASLLNNSNQLTKEDANLISLMQTIIASFMPQAISRNIDLSLTVALGSEEAFLNYHCDSGKLKQVFINMIKNAFEATQPGNYIHIEMALLPSADASPSKISIAISNNGHPIPEEALESIFQPFVTFKKNGTGVGLALARKVIDLHYGSISVVSDECCTNFTILLPI